MQDSRNMDLSDLIGMKNVAADLLPTKKSERNWGIYSYFATWIGMDIGIPTYYLASSLMVGGMDLKWAMFTILLANVLIAFPILANGHAGAKYGIPSTIYWRSAFGFNGASVAAILRGVVAAGWAAAGLAARSSCKRASIWSALPMDVTKRMSGFWAVRNSRLSGTVSISAPVCSVTSAAILGKPRMSAVLPAMLWGSSRVTLLAVACRIAMRGFSAGKAPLICVSRCSIDCRASRASA